MSRALLLVGPDFYVAEAEIVIIQRFPSRPAEAIKKRAETEGIWYNATRGGRILSLVLLRSGWVVGSPNLPDTLATRPRVEAPVKPPKKP